MVAKTSTSKCTAKGPCSFKILVTNTGDAEVKGPIVIDEQIGAPGAALAGGPNAPWTCTKAAPFSCTHPGPLAVKSSTELNLSFAPNTAPDVKTLKNCAIVKAPPPAAAPEPAKQLAPDKKSEAPFGGNPLVKFASFRVPPRHANQSFVQRVVNDGGGNIGGAPVSNKCLAWGIPPKGFSLDQGNGIPVAFMNMTVTQAGVVTGTASYISDNGPVTGKVIGSSLSADKMSLLVKWQNGSNQTYIGAIDANGLVSGSTVNSAGVKDTMKSNARFPLVCVRNEICSTYANKATAQANEFQRNHCGPPVGRLVTNPNDHLNWCMAGFPNQPLDAENAERQKAIDECIAKNLSHAASEEKISKLKIKPSAFPAPGANAPATEPAPEQCAVVPIDPETAPATPLAASDLTVKKTLMTKGLGPGQKKVTCTLLGKCPFVIEVSNTGNAPYVGPLDILDVLREQAPAANQQLPGGTPGWVCVNAGTFLAAHCHNAAVTIAPGGPPVRLLMQVTPGPNWKKTDTLTNCATVSMSGEVKSKRQACAAVKLDPFKLHIDKTGPDTCPPGSLCTFTLSLFNPGPIDHNAPVTFTDGLSGAPPMDINSIEPPLPCAAQPTRFRSAARAG